MTITTYAELQSNVADFLNRQDLTAQIPTFIALAEASMNRRLRHWRMERRSTAIIDAQYIAAPLDYLETIQFDVRSNPAGRMQLIGHSDMSQRRYSGADTAGTPRFYNVTAGEFEFYPTPDESYTAELVYYSKIAALSDDNTSNWLLEYSPDAYLYGALSHSAGFLQEDSRLALWGGLFADTISGLNTESQDAKYGGTGLKMKLQAR